MIKLKDLFMESKATSDEEKILSSIGYNWDQIYNCYRRENDGGNDFLIYIDPFSEKNFQIKNINPNTKFIWNYYDDWQGDNLVEEFVNFKDLIDFLKKHWHET